MVPVSASPSLPVNTSAVANSVSNQASSNNADCPPELSTVIGTVWFAGTLEDKLTAAAAAGFDGVEILKPDFVVSPMSATQVRAGCADLGLSIDLYQPFRELDNVRPEGFAANLREIDRNFDVMGQLGCAAARSTRPPPPPYWRDSHADARLQVLRQLGFV